MTEDIKEIKEIITELTIIITERIKTKMKTYNKILI
jgi:hypothetical protein